MSQNLTWFLVDAAIVVASCSVAYFFGKKGLHKHFTNIIVFVIAAICAINVSNMFLDSVYSKISPKVDSFVGEKVAAFLEDLNAKDIIDTTAIEEKLNEAVGKTGKTIEIDLDSMLKLEDKAEEGTEAIIGIVSPILKELTHWLLAFLIFLVARLIGNLLAKLLSKAINKIPIVGWLDHILGAALGIVFCYIIIFVIFKAGKFLEIDFFKVYAENSQIAKFLY